MKEWNEYLKTLIFVETSVKSHSTLTVRETFRRAAEKGVTNVKLDNGGATLVGVTFKTYKAMADVYGWPSTWEGFVTMTFEEPSKSGKGLSITYTSKSTLTRFVISRLPSPSSTSTGTRARRR